MNLKKHLCTNSLLILFSAVLCINAEEIWRYHYNPEPTGLVLCTQQFNGKTKSAYRLYGNDEISTLQYLTDKKKSGDHGAVYRITKNHNYTYYTVPQVTVTDAPIELGGYYFIVLYPYLLPQHIKSKIQRLHTNVLSFAEYEDDNLCIKIDYYDDAINLQSKLISNSEWRIENYTNAPNNSAADLYREPYIANRKKVSEAQYLQYLKNNFITGSKYLKLWENELDYHNVPYTHIFYTKRDDGAILPAILCEIGQKHKVYAMFGQWTDEKKAKQYGYSLNEKIYFQEKTDLPDDNSYNLLKELSIETKLRFGLKTFHETEILENKKEIYPLLAWRKDPLNSQTTVDHTSDEGTAFDRFNREIPNTPDNDNNTNPLGLQDCPDMDYYWDKFCECAKEKFGSDDKEKQTPGQFVNYEDYLEISLMEEYDPTQLGTDGSVEPVSVSIEKQPINPFIYNKDCVLLNGEIPAIVDPWADDTRFVLKRKIYEKGTWGDGEVGGGYELKNLDVSLQMKDVFDDLKIVYENIADNTKPLFNQNFDRSLAVTMYEKKIKAQNWSGNGEIILHIEKDFLDSIWYVGNPFENYLPYNDIKDFIIFDVYAVQGKGPFKTRAFQSIYYTGKPKDELQWEQYNAHVANPKAMSKNTTKDWYVFFKYPLVYRDKYSRLFQIGTVEYGKQILDHEDRALMPPGYEWVGGKHNTSVKLTGTKLYDSDMLAYNKRTKEYRTDQYDLHDRNAEEFGDSKIWTDIARRIIIAEVFDAIMKTMHYISQKRDDQVGYASGALYEVSKRIENRLTQSWVYKLAVKAYEGYTYWKKTMDNIKRVRDTYRKMQDAWDGLLYTINYIFEYYETLDWKSIRPTNITKILPIKGLYYLDYQKKNLQASMEDFTIACDILAFQTDLLTHGNYGPINPVIRAVYGILGNSALQASENTTKTIENAAEKLDEAKAVTQKTASDQVYLSNITKASYNIIRNQRNKLCTNGTAGMASALYVIQAEAKQWETFAHCMDRAADLPRAVREGDRKNSLLPVVWQLKTPRVFGEKLLNE